MKIEEKKLDPNGLVLQCHVKEKDYQSLVESSLSSYRKRMNIPGFRPGKVPIGLVKKQYGVAIKVEEINKLLSNNIQQYIKDKRINILGGPIPLENNIDFDKSSDFIFEYELGLQPEVDLSLTQKAKLDFYEIHPDSQMINEHILSLQKQFGKMTNPDQVNSNDMLSVEFTELDSKKQNKEGGIIKSTSILVEKIEEPKVKKEFLIAKKNDVITFLPKKVFSNLTDLASMLGLTKEELDNNHSYFNCKINSISRLIPSELNQDFFKKVYPDRKIKNKKELNSVVTEDLKSKYKINSDNKFFNDVSSLFIQKTKIDFPEKFLKKWLKINAKKKFNDAEFNTEFKNYLKYLSWQLIENKICQENGISIKKDELRDFVKSKIIQQMKSYGNLNLPDKEIDGIVDNVLANEKELDKMRNELLAVYLIDFFKTKMKLNRKIVSYSEFVKLVNK